ncbi:MAG TPA: hypothetical protein VIX17_14265 [Pyrinomonadaceae bacterium]|jgi:hypothetical protein
MSDVATGMGRNGVTEICIHQRIAKSPHLPLAVSLTLGAVSHQIPVYG